MKEKKRKEGIRLKEEGDPLRHIKQTFPCGHHYLPLYVSTVDKADMCQLFQLKTQDKTFTLFYTKQTSGSLFTIHLRVLQKCNCYRD